MHDGGLFEMGNLCLQGSGGICINHYDDIKIHGHVIFTPPINRMNSAASFSTCDPLSRLAPASNMENFA